MGGEFWRCWTRGWCKSVVSVDHRYAEIESVPNMNADDQHELMANVEHCYRFVGLGSMIVVGGIENLVCKRLDMVLELALKYSSFGGSHVRLGHNHCCCCCCLYSWLRFQFRGWKYCELN